MNDKIKKNLVRLLILIIAVAANCFGSFIARNISLPLYLDSVLTIAVTAIGGLWWGIACAVLSNVTLYLFDYSMLPFTICHILTAVFAWLTFKRAEKPFQLQSFLWAGLWCGLSNAITGNLISDLIFSAATGVDNIDNAVRAIYIAIGNLRLAIYLGGLITNLVDKFISAAISFLVYRLICKVLPQNDQ